MPVVLAIRPDSFIQYNGNNAAEVQQALSQYVPRLTSTQNGNVLTLHTNDYAGDVVMNVGDWLPLGGTYAISDADFQASYYRIPTA